MLIVVGSNQSDGGPLATERSGSTESQNGEKKASKPTRKISRFLVSPVVDRENVAEDKIPEVEPKFPEPVRELPKETQVNGLPETEKEVIPQVPTHQYSAQMQSVPQNTADLKPIDAPQVETKPEIPLPQIPAPLPVNIPIQPVLNSMLGTTLQPNLTTPLQIATDTPLLGLSQVGTPIGADLGLNMGVGQSLPLGHQTLTPTPGVNDALPNAENIHRMLLKQNIMK